MGADSVVPASAERYVRATSLADVEKTCCLVVPIEGYSVVLFLHEGKVHALDNRCPHMGFPLHRGSAKDGILTCHWHHARFDLASGGTFDSWADDARAFPVQIRGDDVWVDMARPGDLRAIQRQRLHDGLERNIPLVIAKSVIALLEGGDVTEPFRVGIDFGVRCRRAGWGPGLTMHACLMNLLPYLDQEDHARALYHGLSASAGDAAGSAPRFAMRPLPALAPELPALKRWFREFVAVRDAEGAERCVVSAVGAIADHRQLADLLFSAATDTRYTSAGHVADFTNKALEALDVAGWEHAEAVLGSLAPAYAGAGRMEETNAWRHPVDLVSILDAAFEALPAAIAEGEARRAAWSGREGLVPVLLGEDPQAVADALLAALRQGCSVPDLAGTVAYAAALRVARFHTSNDFGDWDTALHTFTFANAIDQGLRRAPSCELLRGVFDAAMSVYLDRFLNIPPARLPEPAAASSPQVLLEELLPLLDGQQQVNQAGDLVARYLHSQGDPGRLQAMLGRALLREDRDFHTIQMVEAAFRQYGYLRGTPAGTHVLVAAGRYLAAHAPTRRSQGQTYRVAERLHRGEHLFEEEE